MLEPANLSGLTVTGRLSVPLTIDIEIGAHAHNPYRPPSGKYLKGQVIQIIYSAVNLQGGKGDIGM